MRYTPPNAKHVDQLTLKRYQLERRLVAVYYSDSLVQMLEIQCTVKIVGLSGRRVVCLRMSKCLFFGFIYGVV